MANTILDDIESAISNLASKYKTLTEKSDISYEDMKKYEGELENLISRYNQINGIKSFTTSAQIEENLAQMLIAYEELVDKVASVDTSGGGSTVLTFEDLTQEQKDSLKGEKGDPGSGDGSLTVEQIEKINSIDDKVSLTKGKNLFNINDADVVIDNFVSYDTGDLLYHTSYNSTHFIDVEENASYTLSYKHMIAWYDKDKVFISGSNSTDSENTVVAPIGAKFLRCTTSKTAFDFFQVELGSVLTVFEPFRVPYLKLSNKINPLETTMFEKSRNLFDKSLCVDGYFVSWIDGSLGKNVQYSSSAYIEIEENKDYFMSNNGNIKYLAWFDENLSFISGNQSDSFPLLSPIGSKYVRVTVSTDKKDTSQFEQNTEASAFIEPYKLVDMFIDNSNFNKWNNKKWATLGDSLTAQLKFQPKIYTDLGLVLINNGVGGAKLSSTDTGNFLSRVSELPDDADIISVMGGTNDWAQGVLLGDDDSVDIDTFYGALNVLIEALINKYPTKRIFFMTTPYGEFYDFAARGWSSADLNNSGLSTKDYAQAVKNRCVFYKIPCVDVHNEAGWNSLNISNYMTDDGAYIHVNDLGGERVADLVIDLIKKL